MMRNPLFLYETLDALASAGMLSPMPDIIERNLASSIQLREYQVQAFQNFVTYFENENLRKNKQVHTLFHMATGSGKTIIMAGLILYLYTKGYRKFLFFVNQTNILEKTKLNFTDGKSSKYLFAETISYLGREIQIRPVINFAGINRDSKDIYICFTSTQKLHLDLFAPQENSLTYEDFEDDRIVFISDESHHVNTLTKNATMDEEANRRSWEYSVMNAFSRNRDNVLLEFTATADIKDRNVRAKYLDKMITDYPLAKFRQSGYTKDFQNFATDTDLWTRALIALVMSEYRKYLFTDIRQNIKPVIMMKSQYIYESENFYDLFFRKMETLDVAELESLYNFEIKPLQEALAYFTMKHGDLNVLCRSIKDSFTKETSIIMNGAREDNTENQILVNSLEDKNNPIRLIFAVDMLNEGWDVLNLFDIVRLYDTRQSQSGGKIGSYTIKEAQLIGRAARYCPFIAEASQERFQRKYDNDLDNKYRYLETMYFHSKNDSRYINELKQALIATGLQEEDEHILEYKIKDTFKSSDLYLDGLVFSNQREEKERSDVYAVDERLRNKVFSYHTAERRGQVINLFDVQVEDQVDYLRVAEPEVPYEASSIWRYRLKGIPYNIVSGVASGFYELSFSVLKMKYPNLKSLREFLCSEDYIGNITIEISYTGNLETKSIYKAVQSALMTVAKHITEIKQEYQGSTVFEAKRLKSVVKDKKVKLGKIDEEGGRGASQVNNTNTRFALDLAQRDWYIFNDNYGTSEEKLFLRYFDAKIAPQLKAKNLEFYVIRNERIPDLAIYSFNTGERFEPDFLLFIRKRKEQTFSAQQVYVEPKGSHLLLEDAWKEQFLLELTSVASVDESYTFGNEYKIIGLPFFNEEQRLTEFEEAMESFVEAL
jgi:type III restriction enzyme